MCENFNGLLYFLFFLCSWAEMSGSMVEMLGTTPRMGRRSMALADIDPKYVSQVRSFSVIVAITKDLHVRESDNISRTEL